MKWKLAVVILTLLYAAYKFVQLAVYIASVWWVIDEEYCDGFCLVERSELAFLFSLFVPLVLLVYGAVKVDNMSISRAKIFRKCLF